MPKKAAAAPDINISALVREALTLDKNATPQTVQDYIIAKHPDAKINKNSFSVAFYTIRRKLAGGGKPSKRGRKMGIRKGRPARATSGSLDMAALKAAAQLLSLAGSPEAAHEIIKTVQAVQIQ